MEVGGSLVGKRRFSEKRRGEQRGTGWEELSLLKTSKRLSKRKINKKGIHRGWGYNSVGRVFASNA